MPSDRVLKALAITAELFGKEFSEEAAEMLAMDLEEYPEDKTLAALNRCRKELRYFPTVSEIVSRINPEEDPQAQAVLAAANILEALKKDGNTNYERARQRMGELAWAVVQKLGGWLSVCERSSERSETANLAQWRDLAKAIQTSGLSCSSDRPRLTGPTTNGGAAGPVSLANILKQIPMGGKESDHSENKEESSQEKGHEKEEEVTDP